MPAILPLAETIVLGGVDGALRSADAKGGRTATVKQFSTWYEAALVGVGAIAAMNRVHPDWWEPAVVGGLFGLSQRAGQWVGHQAGIGGPGYGMFRNTGLPPGVRSGFRAFGGPDPLGLPLGYPPGQHVQPAGALA